MPDAAQQRAGDGPGDREHLTGVELDGVDQGGVARADLRKRGQLAQVRALRVGVEHVQQQLHTTDAVGERVMDLQDERRPTAVHPLDQGGLPHRAHGVEGSRADLSRQVQHGVHGRRCRDLDPADVPGQVEVGVDDPLGRREPQRRFDHLLPEHRHCPGEPLQAVRQVPEGGRSVEPDDDDDRHAQ